MRIGIDAHIILPQHKHYNPKIACFAEQLITNLIEADRKNEHTWVLFFDERMKDSADLKKFQKANVEIQHFPFVQYRQYLPVLYSHMLVSAFLRSAKLDVFHSPEGLIPMLYPGKIVTNFHYVPRGVGDSNIFVKTFMLGARPAFAQMCKRARRIVVSKRNDKKLLTARHGYPEDRVVLIENEDMQRIDWSPWVKTIMKVYEEVASEDIQKKEAKLAAKAAKKEAKQKAKVAKAETKKAKRKK